MRALLQFIWGDIRERLHRLRRLSFLRLLLIGGSFFVIFWALNEGGLGVFGRIILKTTIDIPHPIKNISVLNETAPKEPITTDALSVFKEASGRIVYCEQLLDWIFWVNGHASEINRQRCEWRFAYVPYWEGIVDGIFIWPDGPLYEIRGRLTEILSREIDLIFDGWKAIAATEFHSDSANIRTKLALLTVLRHIQLTPANYCEHNSYSCIDADQNGSGFSPCKSFLLTPVGYGSIGFFLCVIGIILMYKGADDLSNAGRIAAYGVGWVLFFIGFLAISLLATA